MHLMAMLCVNAMTIIWSIILILKENALYKAHSVYAWIGEYADEDWFAAFFLTISAVQVFWILYGLKPLRWKWFPYGSAGYALLLFWWSFALLNNLLGPNDIQPTGAASLIVFVALCVFAFAGVPKGADHAAT